LKKNTAIRDQLRHAGNENPLKWMDSGNMGWQNYFQNSYFPAGTVELGLGMLRSVENATSGFRQKVLCRFFGLNNKAPTFNQWSSFQA